MEVVAEKGSKDVLYIHVYIHAGTTDMHPEYIILRSVRFDLPARKSL